MPEKPKNIRVRFNKNGFYHPTFGLLGRGANRGKVYWLPAVFAEKETIKVDVMDRRTRPPQKIGEQEITRWKYLPSDVEVLDDLAWQAEVEEAEERNNKVADPVYPPFSQEAEVYLKKMGVKNPTDEVKGQRLTNRRKAG